MRTHGSRWARYAQSLAMGVLALGVIVIVQVGPSSSSMAAPAPKVEVCHVPPDDPTNFHTIRISENALARHLEHGDVAGACNDVCAVLCDDDNQCTVDDTGDCETVGCPTEPETVDCDDTNACTDDMCIPATGCEYIPLTGTNCSVANPGICEESTGICDSNGTCEPDRTQGCCLSTAECEAWDTNLCTLEECVGNTCVPTGSVVTCDAPACYVSVCLESTGECSDPEPEVCPDGEVCNDGTGECEPGCFTMRNAAGSGDSIAACIDACQPHCPPGICELKFQNATLVNQCLIDGDPTACATIDDFGAQNGCNICEPEQGPDVLLCTDSYCDRHDSLTGVKRGPFITDYGYGTFPGAFTSTGGYRGRTLRQGQWYVRSYTPAGVPDGTPLVYGQGNPPTTSAFNLKDVTATHMGHEYFAGDGSPHWPNVSVFQLLSTWPTVALTTQGAGSPCGYGSNRLVAAPADPLAPNTEELYVVTAIDPVTFEWVLSRYVADGSLAAPTFSCAGVVTTLFSPYNTFQYPDRLRVDAANETVFLSAIHPAQVNPDEGLYRVEISSGVKTLILPLSQNPDMVDFAIGPHDGLLYVLFAGSTNPRVETFDPVSGASQGVLFQNAENFRSIEFFPN